MLFLRLLGIAPPGVEVVLEPLRAESAPPVVMPDYVASLSVANEDPGILHVEFFLRYRSDVPGTMARYGGSLAWQYRRPVRSVLLLLRNDNVPEEIPEVGEFTIGETVIRHPFRTVRLWELDPAPVLDSGDPGLLPWALLMKLGREEAARLGAEVGASGNEQWIARFLTLGSLRYHREELQEMLAGGGFRMGLVEAIVEGSSLVAEVRDQAEARGEAKGQVAEARRLLRLALTRNFPGLESMAEIDAISNVADLEDLLLQHACRSQDRDAVSRAIVAAATRQ